MPNSPAPMDQKLLPRRALLDTGVFIRALGEHPSDPRSQDCKDFLIAMVNAGADVLVAAPSIAEMIRGMAVPQVPVTGPIITVPFDDQAAVVLGTTFPMSSLKKASHGGQSLTYLKYDALIGACAIRHKADFLITIDGRFSTQIPKTLKVAPPGAFRTKQLSLVPVPTGPSSAPPVAAIKPGPKKPR